MTPESDGTKGPHEVEVDWGNLTNEMVIGLRDNYEQVRAGILTGPNPQKHKRFRG